MAGAYTSALYWRNGGAVGAGTEAETPAQARATSSAASKTGNRVLTGVELDAPDTSNDALIAAITYISSNLAAS